MGSVPAPPPQIDRPSIPDPSYQQHLNDCVYAVEANSNETHQIWERFCSPANLHKYHKRYVWIEVMGWLETIGELNNRPICVSLRIVKMDGWPVLFWKATSQLVDYKMIDKWFKEHFPTLQQTDATNMHHAIHEIQRLEKER